MTAGQVPGVEDLGSAPATPCPCGHGDVATEMARQRPLIERVIAGDPRAFTELYDDHVDDVYRYLLAWTGDEAIARGLTAQVLHGAANWLQVIVEEEGDLAAWLLTMARDAVAQHRGAGWAASLERVDGGSPDVLVAAAQLDDAHRDVVVLRLLLGHSVAHTAHLAGYSASVVTELQLAACSTIWQVLSGTAIEPAPPGAQDLRPRWFEGSLEGAYFDPSSDPGLSDVLAVADALRQAAPQQVPLPDDEFVRQLREQLLGELGGAAPEQPGGTSRLGRAFGLVRLQVSRHPWVATVVAAGAIGLVFGLQAVSSTGSRSACGGGSCLASTTGSTPGGAGVGAPALSTIGPTTISANSATTSAPSTTLPPTTTGAQATAPSGIPPTTVAPTTRTTQRQATTTTRRKGKPSTTTAPTTTLPPTTTTTRNPPGNP
jgi:DNA-directed RNA polymerase specialized sigma24 family protein